jgi:hypothetical protein
MALNPRFWCGDWEEIMMENGYGILNMKKGCIYERQTFNGSLHYN